MGLIGLIIVESKRWAPEPAPSTKQSGWICHKCGQSNPNFLEKCDCGSKRSSTESVRTSGSGSWKCQKCGKTNPNYTGTCSCGLTKKDSAIKKEAAQRKIQEVKNVQVKDNETEIDKINKIKMYKELLDSGAISQEEYDAKKKQLLS